MSWQMTALVKAHFRGPPALKLLAFTLADYASPEGDAIRPSIARLALDTGIAERTLVRYMGRLRSEGFIERVNAGMGGTVRNKSGGRIGVAASYRINPEWFKGNPATVAGNEVLTPPITGGYPATQVADKYSREPITYPPSPAGAAGAMKAKAINSTGEAAVTMAQWLEHCVTRGVMPIGSGDRVFRFRIPPDLLHAQWDRFKRISVETGSVRKPDGWRMRFRSSCRTNEYGLWTQERGEWAVATPKGLKAIEEGTAAVAAEAATAQGSSVPA